MSILEYRSAEIDGRCVRPIWLLWAIYLAMSWTWCIGMFLPVLLVRDFGGWGWVCFAIPNVVGAAAVGWINRSAEQSQQTVAAHLPMMTGFSWLTAAFQVFFACWIFSIASDDAFTFVQLTLWLSLFAVALPSGRTRYGGLVVSALVLAVSLVCIYRQMKDTEITFPPASFFNQSTIYPRHAGLFAATCFGFLLCPHLDLTFHRARQRISLTESQLAFGIGFGVIFLGMISFSLCYAIPMFMHLVDPKFYESTLLFFLCIYWMVQLAFTIGVHWTGGEAVVMPPKSHRFFIMAVTSTIVGMLSWSVSKWFHLSEMDGPEIVYRLFLAFYGLVFPAYVWICMLPGRWIATPTRSQWRLFVVSVVIAAPAFWMSFIERQMIYVIPGIAIPLAARLFVRSPVQQ